MTSNDIRPDFEERVYLERVRIYFHHARGSELRILLATVFIGPTLYFAGVPFSWILIWLVYTGVVAAGTTAIHRLYNRTLLTGENAREWVRARSVQAVALGASLGGAIFLLPPSGSEVAELAMFVILVVAVAQTGTAYTTMPGYTFFLAAASMGLLALSFLRAQDPIHYAFFLMVVVSQVLLLRRLNIVSATTIEGIKTSERLKDEVKRREEAEREAARANAAKSHFLANMSHELRTPMNAVIGFSDALEAGIAGKLSEKQAEYVSDIRNSGKHLLSLINDLLDLSKIEAGMLEIEEEVFDLAEEVDHCLPLLKEQAAKGGVTLAADIPGGLPKLRADRRLVSQMMVNLLSNAVKFTPEGGDVTITAANGASGGIRISVADTGPGIAPEDVDRILLPFEQTQTGRANEGTGLGLPLVKHMAELHGGDLMIASAPGEGTTATISFPPDRTGAR